MRVLYDANIFISYLLHPQKDGPITRIIELLYRENIILLLPDQLLDEFVITLRKKSFLNKRITVEQLENFAALLSEVAEIIPAITDEIPGVTRDPKDDYLLAYASVGRAKWLVTGDDDLLELSMVNAVSIVSPREFASLFDK